MVGSYCAIRTIVVAAVVKDDTYTTSATLLKMHWDVFSFHGDDQEDIKNIINHEVMAPRKVKREKLRGTDVPRTDVRSTIE